MKKLRRVLLWALTALILMALVPSTAQAGVTLVIDLSNIDTTGASYTCSDNIITVTEAQAGAGDTVRIRGTTTSGYSINIQAAKTIIIEENTSWGGRETPGNTTPRGAALAVPAGATVTGEGSGIEISGGTGGATASSGTAIYSSGDITLAGVLGDFTGGGGGGGYTGAAGIYAAGSVTISGDIGDITGGQEAIGGAAISAGGNVIISGTAGDISGGEGFYASGGCAIDAGGDVLISGSVGNISGGNGNGGWSETNIEGGAAIVAGDSVTVSGQTALIQGGSGLGSGADGYAIDATSYAVLDYTDTESLDVSACAVSGYTVTFDYAPYTPTNSGGAPRKAYASNGRLIPAFSSPTGTGRVVTGWYKEAALVNAWLFESDTVTADITLYAAWVVVPSAPVGLSATTGDGSLILSWTTPNDGGSAITKYQYSVSQGADNWQDVPESSASTTGYTVTGLNNGTNYTVKVRAVNAAGAGAEAVTNAAPVAPTFAFTVSAGEGGSVTGTASGAYVQGTPISITAVPNNGYSFVGWMENDMLISRSADLSFTMPGAALTLTAHFAEAPVISAISATPTVNGAVLEVSASGEGLSYQWQVKGSWIDIPGATSARYDYSGLEPGKTYTVRVLITDAAGNSTVSPEISFTVGATPITGLPESYTLIKGKSVRFTPVPSGGAWTYDSDYLSLSESGGTATFTAKKAGKTYATYTAGGTQHIVVITINAGTIPQTGDAVEPFGIWLYVLAGALTLGSAGIWAICKRKGRYENNV